MELIEKIKMLYLISGRSAASWNIGRKIPEVTKAFREHADVDLFCGGDIKGGRGYQNETHEMCSVAEYHAKWYRRNSIVNFFVRSISEMKDMAHCFHSYQYIKNSGNQYELIWERSSRLHCAGIFYAKRHSIPCVLEWKDHLIDNKWSLFKPLALYVEKWKNRSADYIAVESEVLKDMLISEGVNPDKIYVTYNAVNPEEFRKKSDASCRIREELGIGVDEIIVGYVGSYAFYHDSIRMIKAAKILRDKGIDTIKWLLIGDGKDKNVCEQLARKEGLYGDSVLMLPFQNKEVIPDYLSAMDVTVLPGSTDIICPIKVMEYMAAKSVVLVPDYACNREIIDGTNGLLFTPFDEMSMAMEIVKVSKDRNVCRQLGDAARETVCEKLTWGQTYGHVLRIILSEIEDYGK